VPLESLRKAKKRTVGTKQTQKAIEKGVAKMVFIARDADDRVVRNIIRGCQEGSIQVEYVESMAELGRACGIDVGAASAAIIDE